METDEKQHLLTRNNELQLKVDDLESLLDSEQHERKKLMTKIEEQKAMIENIRIIRDESIPYESYKKLEKELEEVKTLYETARRKYIALEVELKTEEKSNAALSDELMAKGYKLNKLKMSSDNYRHIIEEQSREIDKLCQKVQNMEELKSDLETERAENLKLKEEFIRYKKEILNESLISVDDPNQSFIMMKRLSIGGVVESETDTKINEMQIVIDMKTKEVDELANLVTRLQNEAIAKQKMIDKLIKEKSTTKPKQVNEQKANKVNQIKQNRTPTRLNKVKTIGQRRKSSNYLPPEQFNRIFSKRDNIKSQPMDGDRLSVLQKRNQLCGEQQKDSYAIELPFLARTATPEIVKYGSNMSRQHRNSAGKKRFSNSNRIFRRSIKPKPCE